jgi:WD40 repeat protein
VAVSPDGRTLFASNYWQGAPNVFDLHNPMKTATKVDLETVLSADSNGNFEMQNYVQNLTFSPDGKYLAGKYMAKCLVWDVRNQRVVRSIEDDFDKGIVFSPDSRRVVTLGKSANLWDLASGEMLFRFSERNSRWLQWSADGHRVYHADGKEFKTFNGEPKPEPLDWPKPDRNWLHELTHLMPALYLWLVIAGAIFVLVRLVRRMLRRMRA